MFAPRWCIEWLTPLVSRAWRALAARLAWGDASVAVPPAEHPAVTVVPPTAAYLGRPVLVVTDLAMLRGPLTGTVTLPLQLHWSGDDDAARYDLDDARQRLPMYVTVLREAGEPGDLAEWVDGAELVALWPRLGRRLPKTVREAWEQQHQVLREAGAAPGLRAAS